MERKKGLSHSPFLLVLFLLFLVSSFYNNCEIYAQTTDFDLLLNNYEVYPEPNISKPDYLKPYTDPSFDTRITRITNMASLGIQIKHYYSLHNPWNADSSYLILVDSVDWHLYDGQTYQYIKKLNIGYGGRAPDPIWHPKDPNIIYYQYGNKLIKLDVSTNQYKILRTFPQYAYVTVLDKGTTISPAGKTLLTGLNSSKLPLDIFVYNYFTDQVGPAYKLKSGINWPSTKWAGISHSGNYAVVGYEGQSWKEGDGYSAYSINSTTYELTYLGNFYNNLQHADVAVDEDGSDVFVLASIDSGHAINKYKFSDLSKTIVHSGLDWSSELHISGRCTNKPGWVIVSTYSDANGFTDGWTPFEDEVWALKLDGSGEVRRITHTHSQKRLTDNRKLSYWAEPQATVNKNCTQIMFRSNWRDLSNNGNNVDVYVIDLRGNPPPFPPQGLLILPPQQG